MRKLTALEDVAFAGAHGSCVERRGTARVGAIYRELACIVAWTAQHERVQGGHRIRLGGRSGRPSGVRRRHWSSADLSGLRPCRCSAAGSAASRWRRRGVEVGRAPQPRPVVRWSGARAAHRSLARADADARAIVSLRRVRRARASCSRPSHCAIVRCVGREEHRPRLREVDQHRHVPAEWPGVSSRRMVPSPNRSRSPSVGCQRKSSSVVVLADVSGGERGIDQTGRVQLASVYHDRGVREVAERAGVIDVQVGLDDVATDSGATPSRASWATQCCCSFIQRRSALRARPSGRASRATASGLPPSMRTSPRSWRTKKNGTGTSTPPRPRCRCSNSGQAPGTAPTLMLIVPPSISVARPRCGSSRRS